MWEVLLELTNQVKLIREMIDFCVLSWQDQSVVSINQLPNQEVVPSVYIALNPQVSPSTNMAVIQKQHRHFFKVTQAQHLTVEEITFLETYLPYCFFSIIAHQEKRAITVSHFAQSLDGKIATLTGDSKWIGNPENLIHAHRMRALCNGILIGAGTLIHDKPSLTVRHVSGENPVRFVVCSQSYDFSSLVESATDPIVLLSPKKIMLTYPNISVVHFETSNGSISSKRILEYLYEQGITSVYVEGGAITTSKFLKNKCIDILQLHLSPQLFGSGISSIQLPEIESVKNAIQFKSHQFLTVGDSIMFVGEPSN